VETHQNQLNYPLDGEQKVHLLPFLGLCGNKAVFQNYKSLAGILHGIDSALGQRVAAENSKNRPNASRNHASLLDLA
jgi:hypothetical protein